MFLDNNISRVDNLEYTTQEIFCIVGKFGSNNVWQKWMDKYFGLVNE